MENRIKLGAVVKRTKENPVEFSASREMTFGITIVLLGSNLPVRLRGVKFLIVDQEMDEVILGRPFLCAIGLDLESHL